MKAFKVITLFLTAVLIFCSCGKSEIKDISMYDLCKSMSAGAGFEDMTYISNSDDNAADNFTYISDLEYDKVNAWFDYYASDGAVCADEIAVIEVKDSNDTVTAENSLRDHLEYRTSLYKTYAPEQVPKLNKAAVFSYENFAVLIISDNPSDVKSAFMNAVNN